MLHFDSVCLKVLKNLFSYHQNLIFLLILQIQNSSQDPKTFSNMNVMKYNHSFFVTKCSVKENKRNHDVSLVTHLFPMIPCILLQPLPFVRKQAPSKKIS